MSTLSVTLNKALTAQARQALKGKWGLVVGATLFLSLANVVIQMIPVAGPIIWIAIAGPLALGFASLYLKFYRSEEAVFAEVFSGFHNVTTALVANLLMTLFIFLWALLLIIPGIIAAYSYMLTFFILADEPALTSSQAITKSKEMMKGYKWKAFCLSSRFIGWAILTILTFGIAFLWLAPYMGMSFACFYEDIKQHYDEAEGEDLKALTC